MNSKFEANLNNIKKRIEFIDIAKGIAILCIIMGHMEIKTINTVVFTFHVPIFFIISGYFIKSKKENNDLIKSMSKTLLLPYIITCLFVIINTIISQIFSGYCEGINYTILRLTLSSFFGSGYRTSYFFNIEPIGAIWFLLALFWAKLLFNIIIDRKEKLIYVIIFFLIGYISAKFIWLPFSIQSGLVAVLFIYLGNLIKEFDLFSKLNKKNTLILFVIWLVTLIIGFEFNGFDTMSLVKCKFTFIPLNIISAVFGSLTIIGISKYIENIKTISKPLMFLGKNSLIVMCFHLIELNTIPFKKIISIFVNNEHLIITITALVKILWCSFGILLCKYIKVMKKVFNYK